LACSGIYLVSEILSELHDFGRVPEIHPALRERGGSVGLATADGDLVLMVETGDVDILTRDAGEAGVPRTLELGLCRWVQGMAMLCS
jgi:hypothetical protein